MIKSWKTQENLLVKSNYISRWLESNFSVSSSLLRFLDQLEKHGLLYLIVLDAEVVGTQGTSLQVSITDNSAYYTNGRIPVLIKLEKDLDQSEEIVTLFETLRSYIPLLQELYTYSQSKRGLVVKYAELLNGVVTMDYYDYSVRLVHDSKSLLSNVTVSTYTDSANYFELETQGAQGNTLTVQLSVDEQTELTLTSKKDFVPLKEVTEVLDSMFSDLAQYKAFSLTLT